ncbi:MAG: bifunctional 3-deoxy-7-phosphoheptulonate synthase/chorismate mutase type II [Chitinophagaceae bacterium]
MPLFTSQKPFLIAGPCSAESEEQMLEIAHAFQHMPVHMIRAGIWKPRSRPGHFEGIGEKGLAWLKQVKQIAQKPICIEVANKEQVALALKYDIDAVWLGARTTVNPILVQEIADALQGTSLAVLVKNPVNPDIELWSGAIERLQQKNIQDIAAIHRGFSTYDTHSKYRNKPLWAIPIELKRRYPKLPIYCDVSHITGKRDLIAPIAQRAMDLDFDGLMIETHPNPDVALSDALQQITPHALATIIAQLVLKKKSVESDIEIENIRQTLDSMDAEIIEIIGKRMELVKELGKIKAQNNIAIFQQERWREIVESRTMWGESNQLNAEFILRLFELIHDKSIKTQIEVLNQQSNHS